MSAAYLRKIRDKRTYTVLIFNATKNGRDNYIGANTLVELAMAFTWHRKIFILNDIYEPFRDELVAWNCVYLKGDLEGIISGLGQAKQEIMACDVDEQLSFL